MANFTEKAILQSFEEMLAEMPLDRITVTALAKKCGISPNTFYYHFEDLYDLLNRWMLTKVDEYRKTAASMGSLEERLKFVLHYLHDHSRLVHHIADSLSREQLERFIFTQAEEAFVQLVQQRAGSGVPDEEIRRIAEFYCYSVLGFILRFIWQGMKSDIDAEVESYCSVLHNFFNPDAEHPLTYL